MRRIYFICILCLAGLGAKAQSVTPVETDKNNTRDLPNGIHPVEESGRNIIRLFPNPAVTHITIEGFVVNLSTDVDVRDALGRSVMQLHVQTTSAVIDISDLLPGIYFVTVAQPAGTSVMRFVKE